MESNKLNPALHNPQLDGRPFVFEGGPIGVVLSHGLTATVAEVRPLAEILHRHGYSVIGPLLPGHNTSPEELNNCRWQDWANQVEHAYLQLAEKCEYVFVGGESTGALAAILTAVKNPRICGVLTYAPAIQLILKPLDKVKLYLSAPFVASVPKGSLDASDVWQGYPVNPLKAAIQLLKMQDEVKKRLPDLKQPILVVQGRLDTTVDPVVPSIIENQAGSRFKEIHWMEKSSHVVIIDQELEAVAEITVKFIKKVLDGK